MAPELSEMKDITPLFEEIIKHIPAPKVDAAAPLQMKVVSTMYDNYLGRTALGRVTRGTIQNASAITHIHRDGTQTKAKVASLMSYVGLLRVAAESVPAGDVALVAGISDVNIGDTLADSESPEALPPISIEKPTVRMTFGVNNSPFAGQEGEYCTSRNLRERLAKELENDVALRVEPGQSAEEFVVSGRGELHLAILIEKMRREGYELQVSRPEVIYKEENGKTLEPAEDVWIDVPEMYSGMVIKKMALRKGEMKNMHVENEQAHLHFFIPTRGLIGFRNEFIIETKGLGILNSLFAGYFPKAADIEANAHGSLIVHEPGETTSYALLKTQERGELFVGPGLQVYEGQVVGQNAKAEDMVVNVCKMKALTNFRANKDVTTSDLAPQREITIETALEYIGDDELVEVTPKSIRLRKRVLRNVIRNKK